MSGLLHRMVKQARSTQPTVQPLTAPRFAPVANPGPDGFTEIHAMEEAPRRKDQRQEEIAEPVVQKNAAAPAPPEVSQPRMPLQIKTEPTEMQELRVATESKEARSRIVHPEELPVIETQAATRKAARNEAFQDANVDSATVREQPRMLRDEAFDENRLEKPSKTELTAPERAELAMQVKGSPRREPSAPTISQEPQPEQRTEIHITIGSIELRAPQAEARPQAAPFRPRVSLDDFLGRKPEAGA